MFKKSKASTVPTLFSGLSQLMSGRKLQQMENATAWQNCFYQELTSRITEEIFSPLYVENNGRPNVPIRQLVGMLILKEGNDWTDEQMFEACNYNLLVLRALGLNNLSDLAPSPATYYNFKLALLEYEKSTGVDLLEKAFQSLTKDQIIQYDVSGSSIRMDTKLLHSNVAKTTRLQMSLGVIIKFYKSLNAEDRSVLDSEQTKLLESIVSKTPEQYTYRLNKQTAAERLEQLGHLLFELVNLYKGKTSQEYELLNRLWNEHFELVEQEEDSNPNARPKDMKDQGGATLQSAHDPEATYRNKPGAKKQIITGFVSNIVDTCSIPDQEDQAPKLNLITAIQTQAATTSDDKFFAPGIERTRQVLKDEIENALTDGAFNSESNEQMSRQPDQSFNWFLTAIQGAEGYYDFEQVDENTLRVTDRRTGVVQMAKPTPTGKYRIDEHHAKSRYRYFDQKTITNYFRRRAMENYPKWVQGLRANGEATIHQVFCKLNGMKTKYRGLFQHHQYVLARCFWVNFTRINAYLA